MDLYGVSGGLVMGVFNIKITDLDSVPKALISQYAGLEVDRELCETYTARFTISIFDPAAQQILPLKRLVRITHGAHLLFHGYIVNPVWNAKSGTVEVNCVDATLKLKHHYHRFGDYVVQNRYPLDGVGFLQLIDSSQPSADLLTAGVRNNGIQPGVDSVPILPEPDDPAIPQDGRRLYLEPVKRSTNVWESIKAFTSTVIPIEFDFKPIDEEHLDFNGEYTPGILSQVDTAERLGEDKTDSVHFKFGWGEDNLDNFTYEPDGDSIRNYAVVVNPSGEEDAGDEDNKALFHDQDSWEEYGIYQQWESVSKEDSKEFLEYQARQWVTEYKQPVDFFTISPRLESPGVPRFLDDYGLGDTITASARRGYLSKELQGRITKISIKQADMNGNAIATLTCIPPQVDTGEGTGD